MKKERCGKNMKPIDLSNKGYLIVVIVLFAIILALVLIFSYLDGKKNGGREPSPENCTLIKKYVWDMGTQEEKSVQILYETKSGNFWKKDADGSMTKLTGYEEINKPAMKFSFTSEENEALFSNCDIGASDIYRGTLDEACESYSYLIKQGYQNLYTIVEANATDIYLKKNDNYYRYLVIPEAGGEQCTVTFSKIPEKTLHTVLERQVE